MQRALSELPPPSGTVVKKMKSPKIDELQEEEGAAAAMMTTAAAAVRPPAKKANRPGLLLPSQLTRTESVPVLLNVPRSKSRMEEVEVEEEDEEVPTIPGSPQEEEEGRYRHQIFAPPRSTARSSTMMQANFQQQKMKEWKRHPLGHRVIKMSEVWKLMDESVYLRLVDSYQLNDVYLQPVGIFPLDDYNANVTFNEIIYGPEISHRFHTCKMSLDDVMKILYLGDSVLADIEGVERQPIEKWLDFMYNKCLEKKGGEVAANRAALCDFILKEMVDFYPMHLKNRAGIFFRKTTYHNYRSQVGTSGKLVNPSMIVCQSPNGGFEYVLCAHILPIPEAWYKLAAPEMAPKPKYVSLTKAPPRQPKIEVDGDDEEDEEEA